MPRPWYSLPNKRSRPHRWALPSRNAGPLMLSHIATTAAVKRANRLQVVEPLCEEPQSACHQLTMQKQVARMQRNVVRTATRKCRRLEPIISCVCTVTALSLCFAQIEYSNVIKRKNPNRCRSTIWMYLRTVKHSCIRGLVTGPSHNVLSAPIVK